MKKDIFRAQKVMRMGSYTTLPVIKNREG